MTKSILYLGDTSLTAAAGYLAGVLTHFGISFDYLASGKKFSDSFLLKNYNALIISDYPSANFPTQQLEKIAKSIENGMGLLMIGGWESFTGIGGGYKNTILKDVLPVIMSESDDRINWPGSCLAVKKVEHEILGSLPFDTNAPCIGGFNKFITKKGAKVILASQKFSAKRNGDNFVFEKIGSEEPLLIADSFGKGRVAAFASDVAPHWVGPFVDWGNKRITVQAKDAKQIEVGNWYAQFFANLVRWAAVV